MFKQFIRNGNSIRTSKLLLIVGIILISFNLRPAITSVGPLIGFIRDDLDISNGIAGVLTTLPLVSFAFLSFVAPKLGDRFGNEKPVFIGLLVLLAGIILRSTGNLLTLFIGTTLIGVGVAISNVLIPSIVKDKFPLKVGILTGVYTTSLSMFAAIGSGLSVPFAINLNLGWRNSLVVWAVLVLLAILLWFPQTLQKNPNSQDRPRIIEARDKIWQSKIAWQVTIFMGLQSFLFYCLITWLPTILSKIGVDIASAGWMISLMQLVGLPMAFLTPIVAGRLRNQQGIILFIGFLYVIGIAGIMFSYSNMLILTSSVIFLGLGQSASISLALTLFGLRAENSREAAELSGMAQSVGYLLAAVGPIFIGTILDLTQSSIIPLAIFLFLSVIMVITGLGAGKDETVFQYKKKALQLM